MKRLTTLGFIMVLTIAALLALLIPTALAQKPIRWSAVPDPFYTAPGATRNFFVEILNTYATYGATFTVVVTVPKDFTVANPTQTGTLDPAAFKELVFPITTSEEAPVGVYPEPIQVSLDYTIAGASYHDVLTPPATIEVRKIRVEEWKAKLKEWEQQMASKLKAWKEETAKQLSPSLQVSATPTSTEVKPGESFDVAVVVNNVGTGPAKNVVLTLTPPAAFSLRTAPTVTIASIDAGASITLTPPYGLTTKDDAEPGSYSPAISFTYLNALAKSLGLPETATPGTASFSVTVKKVEKPLLEQYMPIIIGAFGALVVIIIVIALARRRK